MPNCLWFFGCSIVGERRLWRLRPGHVFALGECWGRPAGFKLKSEVWLWLSSLVTLRGFQVVVTVVVVALIVGFG